MLNKSYNGNLIHINIEESKLNPLAKIKKLSKKLLNYKYNKRNKANNLNSTYLNAIIDSLIFNKSTHLVSIFKDYLIKDYIEE